MGTAVHVGTKRSCIANRIQLHSLRTLPQRFLFLGSNPPWVNALAESLAASGHPTSAIAIYDSANFRRLNNETPGDNRTGRVHRVTWVFPPGYVGCFEPLFRPIGRWKIQKALNGLLRFGGAPWLVAPYPFFVGWLRGLRGARLIYYNLDDYTLYRPSRAKRVANQELEMVEASDAVICLSQYQVTRLRSRFPIRQDRFFHFPLGVLEEYLNPSPEKVPETATVGYIGNLIDRVDWRFVHQVAVTLPGVRFLFVGSLEGFSGGGTRPGWIHDRASALSLPNVVHVKQVAQVEVPSYYWNFAVNWIPYATEHSFNLASCPTKIMDGLASGRPLVSTALPECNLYSKWILVVESADEAVSTIRRLLAARSDPITLENSRRQLQFVRDHHTWRERATQLEALLNYTPLFHVQSSET